MESDQAWAALRLLNSQRLQLPDGDVKSRLTAASESLSKSINRLGDPNEHGVLRVSDHEAASYLLEHFRELTDTDFPSLSVANDKNRINVLAWANFQKQLENSAKTHGTTDPLPACVVDRYRSTFEVDCHTKDFQLSDFHTHAYFKTPSYPDDIKNTHPLLHIDLLHGFAAYTPDIYIPRHATTVNDVNDDVILQINAAFALCDSASPSNIVLALGNDGAGHIVALVFWVERQGEAVKRNISLYDSLYHNDTENPERPYPPWLNDNRSEERRVGKECRL